MIFFKKIFIAILIFFSISTSCFSNINFKIILKIDNEIITSFDLEKETNYLLALNPRLKKIEKNDLMEIAKKSIIEETIRKNEILKYKKLNLDNSQIDNVLKNIIENLNLTNKIQLENYLKNFDISLEYLKKKIEIENEWKSLIYAKYSKSIKIDKDDLKNKVVNTKNKKFQKEYNLSEIVFNKKKDTSLENQKNKIVASIENVGFENTANIYSISDSSKKGGQIGWVRKKYLSKEIITEIDKLEENTFSDPILIGNNYLILKINEIKEIPVKINKEKELEKMIMIETSKQLDKFSNIFYNKIKLNSKISEF